MTDNNHTLPKPDFQKYVDENIPWYDSDEARTYVGGSEDVWETYVVPLQQQLQTVQQENEKLKDAANAHIKDLYEYAGSHEVMSHIHGWRIDEATKKKFQDHRDKWAALSRTQEHD